MSNRTDIVVETDNAEGQVLLSASRVYDLTEDKTQDTINSEVGNTLDQLSTNKLNNRLVGKKIAIYGDSWATAARGSLGASYIEQVTGETVHVSAIGNKTMAEILAECWDNYNADIYIVEGGLNDNTHNVGGNAFITAVTAFVSNIRAINSEAEIYFITPPNTLEANKYTYLFPLEFYRTIIWKLAPSLRYGVINALKWGSVKYESDNVHPTTASVEYIANYILSALYTFGDEETHLTEYSQLHLNNDNLTFHVIDGNMYFNVKLCDTQSDSGTGMYTIGDMDTNFEGNKMSAFESYSNTAGYIEYSTNNRNYLVFYCASRTTGQTIRFRNWRMPVFLTI